jgi:hypothetical protein
MWWGAREGATYQMVETPCWGLVRISLDSWLPAVTVELRKPGLAIRRAPIYPREGMRIRDIEKGDMENQEGTEMSVVYSIAGKQIKDESQKMRVRLLKKWCGKEREDVENR